MEGQRRKTADSPRSVMIRAPTFRILGSSEEEPRGYLARRRPTPKTRAGGPWPAEGEHDGPRKQEHRTSHGLRAVSAVPRDLEGACEGLRVLVGIRS